MKKTIIGIDLGTTNCTMAYAFLEGEHQEIQQFKISQVTKANLQDEQFSLPSFIYFPLPEELDSQMAAIDWDRARDYAVGLFAKTRGTELPSRVISSVKSWACFSRIDRKKPFLPLQAESGEKNLNHRLLSPLEGCSLLLKHLKEAWEQKSSDHPFNEADVLITVPASFDPSARELVKEAAHMAGYPEIVLLEEPQAAFYAWLEKSKDEWRKTLKVGDTCLIIDVGGGTTDFSLIAVEAQGGDLNLKRMAVGDHLLLGGDNIDLSLAYLAKSKLEEAGHAIDEMQMHSLTHACREAKEKLLGNKPPKSVDVTIMGRGSRLIGGSLKTKILEEEAVQLILNGFFPLVSKEEVAQVSKIKGLQEISLPFAEDPRISCQLAKFLNMNGQFVVPTAVLFNGGTLKAAALRERLMELLNSWAKELNKESVKELGGADYDYAVSLGAVSYGLSRKGKAIRIKSGTARSYYIGVEETGPAIPGVPRGIKGFCVAPFGMEEGTESAELDKEFALSVGEPAVFRFFSLGANKTKEGTEPVVGTVVKDVKTELVELPPIETHLEKGEADGKVVRVKLKSKVTELGFLELWCIADDERKWKLEFSVRE